MRTLAIRNGDFVLGQGGFSTISGAPKLRQDLSILVREALGDDRFHPQYGGVLNEFIGDPILPETEALIRGEIGRLLQNYMITQTQQIERDMSNGLPSRFQPEEILVDIRSIEIQRRHVRMNVKVTVRTYAGESLTILRTVGL